MTTKRYTLSKEERLSWKRYIDLLFEKGQSFVAFPLLFLVIWLQVAYDLSVPVVLIIGLPLLGIGCLLPLRPIKGWLVASQFVNRSIEAGTGKLWADMHRREDEKDKSAD